ncbi:hypothetical protein DM01DRAFT_308592 [Hesseltinella vesiculosa]|uniref:ferric-chelate reductase (NADPH) n=1 Tax=Hesseltinella vesiculosa TaxID=101127 RepID=A0A1X2GVF8_9FUNG|nr:hypothetical protein DM01DRAFT_308592 [Hesseltinella vesiculosa]
MLLPLLLVGTTLWLNSNRAGFLTISLVPFLLGSAGKYSALQLITGMSARRLNLFHRFLGYCMVTLATVHMACMLYQWAKFPKFLATYLTTTKVQHGLAGYACLCLVVLGSLYPVRVYKYEFFLGSHLLAFGFIGSISVHTPYAMRYFLTGILCYVLNLLACYFVQNRMAHMHVFALPDATRLRIRLASPLNHHPGQHVYLCIPKISWFQWHPFTITNVAQSDKDTKLEVYATVRGNFTRQLHQAAVSMDKKAANDSDEWEVMVMGPCGRHTSATDPETMLQQQRTIVIASAGAGVTWGMQMLRQLATSLLYKQRDQPVFTKNIYFCWTVRRAEDFCWFRQELAEYAAEFDTAHQADALFPKLHVALHYTGDPASLSLETPDEPVDELDESLPKSGLLSEKRRDITPLPIQQCRFNPTDYMCHASSTSSLGIFVCGPPPFNRVFKNGVAALDHTKSCQVTLICEDFD